MLIGNSELKTHTLAAEVGVDEVLANLLPKDKVTAIDELAASLDHGNYRRRCERCAPGIGRMGSVHR